MHGAYSGSASSWVALPVYWRAPLEFCIPPCLLGACWSMHYYSFIRIRKNATFVILKCRPTRCARRSLFPTRPLHASKVWFHWESEEPRGVLKKNHFHFLYFEMLDIRVKITLLVCDSYRYLTPVGFTYASRRCSNLILSRGCAIATASWLEKRTWGPSHQLGAARKLSRSVLFSTLGRL